MPVLPTRQTVRAVCHDASPPDGVAREPGPTNARTNGPSSTADADLWFVTIHPYDDGNGRIARAIGDLTLARCDETDTRSYSMSTEIL